MKRIGIDINGVLRDTIGKFTQLYEKHLIEGDQDEFVGQTYKLDMSGNTELEETDIVPFEYKKLGDVDSLELDKHFTFRNKEELFSFASKNLPGEQPVERVREAILEPDPSDGTFLNSLAIKDGNRALVFYAVENGCNNPHVVLVLFVVRRSFRHNHDLLAVTMQRGHPYLLLTREKVKPHVSQRRRGQTRLAAHAHPHKPHLFALVLGVDVWVLDNCILQPWHRAVENNLLFADIHHRLI
jgi:hypothetical protein